MSASHGLSGCETTLPQELRAEPRIQLRKQPAGGVAETIAGAGWVLS